MYQQLLAKIATTLGNVTEVKEVFVDPRTKITKFPAVFYKPDGFTNSFETLSENNMTYQFMMVVLIETKQLTVSTAFNTTLPTTVDAIIAKFNEEWNQGTIDGHRVTALIDTAAPWELSPEQDGLIAFAPLTLQVRLLVDI